MTSEAHEPLSYQRMLRAIGVTLDEERPARFTIIEIPEGFVVVWERREPEPVLEEVHFSHATLIEKAGQLPRGRRSKAREAADPARGTVPGYENLLRALGFEFDDFLAHSILVNEVDGSLLVTYSYVDSSQGYAWRKQMVRLDTADIEQMLLAARDRRHRRRLLGFIH
jgi:hypothetical protein